MMRAMMHRGKIQSAHKAQPNYPIQSQHLESQMQARASWNSVMENVRKSLGSLMDSVTMTIIIVVVIGTVVIAAAIPEEKINSNTVTTALAKAVFLILHLLPTRRPQPKNVRPINAVENAGNSSEKATGSAMMQTIIARVIGMEVTAVAVVERVNNTTTAKIVSVSNAPIKNLLVFRKLLALVASQIGKATNFVMIKTTMQGVIGTEAIAVALLGNLSSLNTARIVNVWIAITKILKTRLLAPAQSQRKSAKKWAVVASGRRRRRFVWRIDVNLVMAY